MGTRHYQTVITKEGETKIRQYGQWDGHPSGQGVEILNYLRTGNLDKYQKNLEKIPVATDKQLNKVEATPNWEEKYPYLSRDCGSQIHQMIENGKVKFVCHCSEEEANKWCEGFYTIDFKKRVFISDFHGQNAIHSLDSLPSDEEYLKSMNRP